MLHGEISDISIFLIYICRVLDGLGDMTFEVFFGKGAMLQAKLELPLKQVHFSYTLESSP